jgi:hypothetical protein
MRTVERIQAPGISPQERGWGCPWVFPLRKGGQGVVFGLLANIPKKDPTMKLYYDPKLKTLARELRKKGVL